MEERPVWYYNLSEENKRIIDEETGRRVPRGAYITAAISILAAGLIINSCDNNRVKPKSELEQYESLPTTNVVAQRGDTESGLIRKYCKEFPTPLTEYVFEKRNGNNGQISAGKTYILGVSTNYPYSVNHKTQ